MSTFQQLGALYSLQRERRFPDGYRGEEIDGIDLVMLAADIAGCLSTFLGNPRRRAFEARYRSYPRNPDDPNMPPALYLLHRMAREARIVSSKLDGYAGQYFAAKAELTELLIVCLDEQKGNPASS